MSEYEFEFFSELPQNEAERQAALDAMGDPEWARESLRVQRKVRREISGPLTGS